MGIKNNLIFICLLVLILLGVGCVSATPGNDADNTTLKISDSNANVIVDTGDACLGQPISLDENYTYNNDGILADDSYIGTFTDLQEKIRYDIDVLDLEYNFTFNKDVDDYDFFYTGVEIDIPLTVNGNGYTISGNNTVAIMCVRNRVILNNITFVDGYYSSGCGAIYAVDDLTINNCTFTNCLDDEGNAIYSNEHGTLSLSGNAVEGIIYNGGKITSETTAVVLDNSTYNVSADTYNLTATLVDDSGNVIYDNNFNFVVNGEKVKYDNFSNGVYIRKNYPIAFGQTYLVSAASVGEEQLTVKTGIIRYINGTYTDLKAMVDATAPGGVLVLPYNFTYDADVDDDSLRHGVNIDKDLVINGNGYCVSGNNSAAILVIDGCNVTLNNITFVDGKFDKNGGAIYSTGNLTINDCTFINCLDSDGYAIHNDGNLSLSNNAVEGIIYNGGGVINSKTTAVVLDNTTYDVNADTYNLAATLVDDNGNNILDSGFEFVVNGNGVRFTSYNDGIYLYEDYAISPGQSNLVGAFSNGECQLTVKTGVIRNIKGTFTDLQEKINAADGVLDLEYNFTFNNDFDDHDDLKVGVIINKTITVNGNGYTISGNNTAAIMYIGRNVVILNNIAFIDGYCDDEAGGAIFSSGNLTINYCTFTNCLDKKGYAIYNYYGNLSLSGNAVDSTIYSTGNITSETTAVVLDNSTYNVSADTYNLTARLVDDNGNVIYDYRFNFVVNGNGVRFTSYNDGVYLYGDYAISPGQTYLVSADSIREEQLTVKTGIIRNIKGTYTDLQARVDATAPGGVLVLPYNFTFKKDFDDDSLRQGVYIDKDLVINGNGNVINGNMSAAMLVIDGCNVTLNNITFVDGVFNKNGGAIYSDGNLTINDCTFTNCLDSDGYAIHNEKNLSLSGNTVEGAIYNSGMITSPVTVVFMNNEAKTFDAFVDAVVYAKLTDDNGNIIVNRENRIMLSTKDFANEDVTIFILNKTDNLYYATVTPVKTGLGAASSANLDDAYPDNEVISQIMHVNPTNRTLVVTFDDNITAFVCLEVVVNVTRTIDGEPVVATVNVTIGNVTKSVTTGQDGLGTIAFDPFKADEYVVNASIAADESYTYTEELYDLTVNKVDSSISIDSVGAVTYPEDVAVSFNVTVPTSVSYVVKTKDGKVVVENTTIADVGADLVLPGLDAGEYTVTIANAENENVTGAVASADFAVVCADSSVNVDLVSVVYGEDIVIPVSCENATGIDYAISCDGAVVANGTIAQGMNISVSDLPAGEYTVKVTTLTDDNHNPASDEANLTIDKATPIIDILVVDILYGEVEMLNVTVSAPGTVNITVNGVTKTLILNADNKAFWNISDLPVGYYLVFAQYNGNENYSCVNTSDVFNVKAITPSMDVKAEDINVGDDLIVEVYLPDDATGNVTAAVDGNYYTSPVNDGKATIIIHDLAAGNYTVPVTYSGDDKYNSISKDVNVTVNGNKSDIIKAPDVTKYFGGPERFVVSVTDYRGNPLVNKSVTININGISYTRTTDANGTASIALGLNSGVYSTTVTVDNSTVNSVVTILTTVNGTDVVKMYRNATQYYATFRDSQGNYLKDGETVGFNINGVFYNRQVSGDKGLVRLNINLHVGKYIVTAINSVTGENTANNITVLKADSEIMMYAHNISDRDVGAVIADIILPGDATGNVIVTVGNDTTVYDIGSSDHTSRDGKTVMFIHNEGLKAGEYNISATYEGDKNYNPSSADDTFVVIKSPKKDLNVTVSANPITVGEDASIVVSGLEDATGNVSAAVGGKTYTAPIKDGEATINVSSLTENVTVVVSYAGDDYYNNFTESVDIVVNPKENATMNIDVAPVTEGQDVVINVNLPENAAGNVTAVVNGKTYTVPVNNGKATIIIPDLAAGNYTVPVTYSGDDKYNSISKDVNVTVNEDKSDIIKAPDVTKYFGGPERFVVTVTDYQGGALVNKTVNIYINGRSYDRNTDVNGTASIALGLNSGVYNATVTLDNKTVKSIVTILSTVNGTDIVKMYRNGTQYFATFLDSQGNYLKDGETVRFNINGVFYDRQVSGDKGLAKLNINLIQGEYVITATNLVTGENTANNITVLALLAENKDITKYYRNATQYTVKVLGDNGKAVGAGETVTFNINGVLYNRTTNESGIAKLNINLQPGDYVITAEYKGCVVSNNIKVLPVLNATDISMKYRDGTQFKATLVDGQGKPYAGQSVTFNINGVFYNRVTGSDGIAKLNINLMPGEYIITSSYGGTSIANKITIKS